MFSGCAVLPERRVENDPTVENIWAQHVLRHSEARFRKHLVRGQCAAQGARRGQHDKNKLSSKAVANLMVYPRSTLETCTAQGAANTTRTREQQGSCRFNDVLYNCTRCGGDGENLRLPTISIVRSPPCAQYGKLRIDRIGVPPAFGVGGSILNGGGLARGAGAGVCDHCSRVNFARGMASPQPRL